MMALGRNRDRRLSDFTAAATRFRPSHAPGRVLRGGNRTIGQRSIPGCGWPDLVRDWPAVAVGRASYEGANEKVAVGIARERFYEIFA
jgi:hypothetical protein